MFVVFVVVVLLLLLFVVVVGVVVFVVVALVVVVLVTSHTASYGFSNPLFGNFLSSNKRPCIYCTMISLSLRSFPNDKAS